MKICSHRLTGSVVLLAFAVSPELVGDEAPASDERSTSSSHYHCPLHLNAFRGEPAISVFVWHFTPTHSSSEPFETDISSRLHAPLRALHAGHGWLTRFQVYRTRQNALFTLGFPRAPAVAALTGPRAVTRRVILQKAHDHRVSKLTYGSHCMDAIGFRFCFTPLAGVLFTVPSRYCALSVTSST
jgi:hypothetical protein